MSRLNPSAFSFVPGQKVALPPQAQQPPPPPIERPEQAEAPAPPPTISLNIGGSKPAPVVAPPPPPNKVDVASKPPTTKITKADPSATKTFTTEKAKTDTNAIAQELKNAADQSVLEDLFGTSTFYLRCNMYYIAHYLFPSKGTSEYCLHRPCRCREKHNGRKSSLYLRHG